MSERKPTPPPSLLADDAILRLYQERKEEAIDETDRKYRRYLLTVANRILGSDEESEECLSDTYLRAWNAIPPAEPRHFLAFLAKITRNLALDRRERKAVQKRIPQELCASLADCEHFLPDQMTIEEQVEAKEIARVIDAYLDGTTERRVYLFIGRYYFMTPIASLAKALVCSESTVNKELAAIRRELKERLLQEGLYR